jgi:DNA-binding winged helix-turn-helix (wHTH) protein
VGALQLSGEVFIDEFGLLHRGRGWVALSPSQERILRVLLDRFGAPVRRQELIEAVWPGNEPVRALDVAMTRLRAKIEPAGLLVHTIRGRGFLLTFAPRVEAQLEPAAKEVGQVAAVERSSAGHGRDTARSYLRDSFGTEGDPRRNHE